jgi:drug/metabolite transporter (DMT)-like permease
MKSKDLFQYILGALIVIGFFALLYLLVATQVPEPNKDLLNLVVGALIGSFATVVGYFYGSSSSSAKKDETISTMLTNSNDEKTT